MDLWTMQCGCSSAVWWCTMAAWAPCWLPWARGYPLSPAPSTLTSTRMCDPICSLCLHILPSVNTLGPTHLAWPYVLQATEDVSFLAQADLLEHLELGVQLPGKVLAHGDVRDAADRLAAAIRQVSTSARLRTNARSMRDKLQREDGIAVAAAIVQDTAAIPQPSATLHMAQSATAEAPKHELTEQQWQVRQVLHQAPQDIITL